MRKVLAAGLLVSLVCASPAQAQEAPTPLDVAPPAATAPLPDWMQYKTPYSGEQNDVRKAHRSQDEIIAWAQDTVTNALSIPAGGSAGKMAEVQKFFAPAAFAQYQTYLSSGTLGEGVRVQSHDLSTITSGDTRILAHGESGGSYRWQVELPLVHSFNKQEIDGSVRQSPGQSLRLIVVIARQPKANGADVSDDALRIESFVVGNVPALPAAGLAPR